MQSHRSEAQLCKRARSGPGESRETGTGEGEEEEEGRPATSDPQFLPTMTYRRTVNKNPNHSAENIHAQQHILLSTT